MYAEGYACLWREFHANPVGGGTEVFSDGAFGNNFEDVGFWLMHRPETAFASTTDRRLELLSDGVGLAFRFFPDLDDRKQVEVMRKLKAGPLGMSVGYLVDGHSFPTYRGSPVRFIHSAVLIEISLCSLGAGAVDGTFCALGHIDDYEFLEDAAKSGRLLNRRPL